MITSKAFWIDATERALATAVQVLLGCIAGNLVTEVDWRAAGVAVLTATTVSLLKSILAGVQDGSPSAVSGAIGRAELEEAEMRYGDDPGWK